MLIGLDEAGRGPLAGPVVCAAVAVPDGLDFQGLKITDSKKMTERQRLSAFLFLSKSVHWSVQVVPLARIEEMNILKASLCGMKQAMLRLLGDLKLDQAQVIIDGNGVFSMDGVPANVKVRPVPKADLNVLEVSCASIIAKVVRDYIMRGLDVLFPEYGFAKHKGYGTKAHIEALRRSGPSPWHRRSFLSKVLSGQVELF